MSTVPVRGASKRASTTNVPKTVFALFGQDDPSPKEQTDSGMELTDLTNRMGRPRANADASSQIPPGGDAKEQACACPKLYLEPDVTKSRNVSWSRYLDEISRIGANGASNVVSMPSLCEARNFSMQTDQPTVTNENQSVDAHAVQEPVVQPREDENPWRSDEALNRKPDLPSLVKKSSGELDETCDGHKLPGPTEPALDIRSPGKKFSLVLCSQQNYPAVNDVDKTVRRTSRGISVPEKPKAQLKATETASPRPKRVESSPSTRPGAGLKSARINMEKRAISLSGSGNTQETRRKDNMKEMTPRNRVGKTTERKQANVSKPKDSGITTASSKK